MAIGSSLVPALSAVLLQLLQSEIASEQLPILIFSECVEDRDWLNKFKWWDESNKREAMAISQTIIGLNVLGLPRQIEFELQKLSGVFFRDCMVHFNVAVTEMEKCGEIVGLKSWEKEFIWIAPQDYPLALPAEAIRRMQIISELFQQGVPVGVPWIVVKKMYQPPCANLIAKMGNWFLIHNWPEHMIKTSFGKLKLN